MTTNPDPALRALEECLALGEKATAGEWRPDGDDLVYRTGAVAGHYFAQPDGGRIGEAFSNCGISDEQCRDNAAFIAAAANWLRTHGRELLVRVGEAEAEVWALCETIREHESAVYELDRLEEVCGVDSNRPLVRNARGRALAATKRLRAYLAPDKAALVRERGG